MATEESLKNDLLEAEKQYNIIMKRWTRAHDKFRELENERFNIEQTILSLHTRLEDIAIEEGKFHDQMAIDFNLDKYGRDKRFAEIKREHNARWDRCTCYIQCPTCKKYNVKMSYKLMRNTFGGERLLFDIMPIEGKKVGVYYYCPECAEEAERNESNA
jgi:hypothetical protein